MFRLCSWNVEADTIKWAMIGTQAANTSILKRCYNSDLQKKNQHAIDAAIKFEEEVHYWKLTFRLYSWTDEITIRYNKYF